MNSNVKINRIAIVGCGRISKKHIDILTRKIGINFQLVGVCDSIREKAEPIGKLHSIPWYLDFNQMMIDLDPDFVVVLTESGNHAEHVISLAKYGKKIIVEKPMALSLEDADEMISICDKFGSRLFVVKQNRFNPAILKLRSAIDNGQLGKITLGTVRVRWCRTQEYYDQDSWRGTWALDGGVLANQAIHHIDMLVWMLGEADSVFAYSKTALANIEAEDTAVAVIRFKNGALGLIEATTATRPTDLEGSISILGSGGTVEISGFAMNELKTWLVEKQVLTEDEKRELSTKPSDVYGFGHQSLYKALTNEDETLSMVDGSEGRKSLELLTAIYQSIETRSEVFLPLSKNSTKLGG